MSTLDDYKKIAADTVPFLLKNKELIRNLIAFTSAPNAKKLNSNLTPISDDQRFPQEQNFFNLIEDILLALSRSNSPGEFNEKVDIDDLNSYNQEDANLILAYLLWAYSQELSNYEALLESFTNGTWKDSNAA